MSIPMDVFLPMLGAAVWVLFGCPLEFLERRYTRDLKELELERNALKVKSEEFQAKLVSAGMDSKIENPYEEQIQTISKKIDKLYVSASTLGFRTCVVFLIGAVIMISGFFCSCSK